MTKAANGMVRVRITLPAKMLADTKTSGIDLSRYVRRKLGAYLGRCGAERWYEDNKEAIDAYNERVRERGCLLKDQGTW